MLRKLSFPSLESPSHSLEHVSREAPLHAPVLENDSDIECEVDLPNWQKLVPSDEIKKLKPKERKRQDTVSGEYHVVVVAAAVSVSGKAVVVYRDNI